MNFITTRYIHLELYNIFCFFLTTSFRRICVQMTLAWRKFFFSNGCYLSFNRLGISKPPLIIKFFNYVLSKRFTGINNDYKLSTLLLP